MRFVTVNASIEGGRGCLIAISKLSNKNDCSEIIILLFFQWFTRRYLLPNLLAEQSLTVNEYLLSIQCCITSYVILLLP